MHNEPKKVIRAIIEIRKILEGLSFKDALAVIRDQSKAYETMDYDRYCQEIKAAFKIRGVESPPDYDPECWRDNYNDGDTPLDAVDSEMSYWTGD